jgi:hypothetical protein
MKATARKRLIVMHRVTTSLLGADALGGLATPGAVMVAD